MKFKRLLILCLSTVFLTSCGGDESGNDVDLTEVGKTLYETSDFSIQVPKEWETVEKSSYPSNVPAQTQIDFRNNIKNEIFTANISISKKELPENISSEDFAKSSLGSFKKLNWF